MVKYIRSRCRCKYQKYFYYLVDIQYNLSVQSCILVAGINALLHSITYNFRRTLFEILHIKSTYNLFHIEHLTT